MSWKDSKDFRSDYPVDIPRAETSTTETILGIKAIFYNSKYERYNYIYDIVCDYLDSYFYGKNLCDFQDNKCGKKRNTSSTTGCCHHFKYKALGTLACKMQLS